MPCRVQHRLPVRCPPSSPRSHPPLPPRRALSVLVKEHLWPKLGGLYTAVEQRPINAVAK